MEVKLVASTQGADELVGRNAQELISYVTRVSNPNNQMNFDTAAKLLKYCIQHKHWSPFEHASMTLEITTSRGIAAQILRHRSFTYQELSQRYQKVSSVEIYPARRQDLKNKQNSIDDMTAEDKDWFTIAQHQVWDLSNMLYQDALRRGIAKEQARFLLPLNTQTTMYMTGSIRSWVHYIELRTHKDTQLEHRLIAEKCKQIFKEQLPDIAEALGW